MQQVVTSVPVSLHPEYLLPSAPGEDGKSGHGRRTRVGGRGQGQALLLASRGGTEEDLKAHELFVLFLALSQRNHCGRIPPEPN